MAQEIHRRMKEAGSGLSGDEVMPKIQYDGFDLIIRTNDHDPAHVHVIRGNGELVFILGNSNEEEPYLDRILSPMKKSDARNALEAVKASKMELLEMWRAIYE